MIDTILAPGARLREVESGILSVLDDGDVGAPYDRVAATYDRAVANATYLRLAWGVTRDDNTRFIDAAFASANEGLLVDVAAGTCVDAAAVYARRARPTVVLDRSIAMLRRGRERLIEVAGEAPSHVTFLQADANALPFAAGSIATILCQGAYHVFPETTALTDEWRRVLAGEGHVFVSSLVRGRWFGDRYLGLLHRSGEIAAPRSAEEFRRRVERELARDLELEAVGNFAYARTR